MPGLAIGIVALLFIRVEGRTLLATLTSYLWFLFSPKIYVWKRKKFFPGIVDQSSTKRESIQKSIPSSSLKIVDKGHLKDLYNKINLKAVNIKGTKINE